MGTCSFLPCGYLFSRQFGKYYLHPCSCKGSGQRSCRISRHRRRLSFARPRRSLVTRRPTCSVLLAERPSPRRAGRRTRRRRQDRPVERPGRRQRPTEAAGQPARPLHRHGLLDYELHTYVIRSALVPIHARHSSPGCRSAAGMGGVVDPVLGEVGVAVDADVGGSAVGERESSGQGQQQRPRRAGHRAT
jgi:hypothetical protein